MSQHSLNTDVNTALAALGSTMKGPGVPPAPLAGMLWLDDSATPWTLKIYDGVNWIPVGTVDATTNVFIADGLAAGRFFAPRANDTPDMNLRLNAGVVFDAVSGMLTGVDSQETATLTAPSTNPRRDIVIVDRLTGIIGVAPGSEAASPADPAIPAGKLPVARINWTVGATAITTGMIDDIRVLNALGLSFADVFSLSGFLTPAAITADQNNYNPSGLATVSTLRLSADTAHSITGLAGGTNGRILIVHNIDDGNITLETEHAGSTATNRFALNGDITLAFNQAAILQYDHISQRWRAIAYQPTGTAPGGLSRSLRFNSADGAYLARTPGSAGNRRTWTWSLWIKRSTLGVQSNLTGVWDGVDQAEDSIYFLTSGDQLNFVVGPFSGYGQKRTTAVFRDPSAWQHLVFVYDSTNATAADRMQIWVNGTRQTQFSIDVDPTLNHESWTNSAGVQHNLGRFHSSGGYFYGGYMAGVHFVDGQALDASAFGEFDENGIWMPKEYDGTYGTNGFWLDFADNSGTTLTTLGKDRSGNNNDWTPNNFSVAAGPGNDSLIDLPVNFDDGGNGRGNYCTLTPIIPVQAMGVLGTYSNGNLDFQNTHASTSAAAYGQLAVSSGKWYFEAVPTNGSTDVYPTIGISSATQIDTLLGVGNAQYAYRATGVKVTNASSSAYGNSFTTGDIVGVAFDLDAGKVFFSKNGVWQNSGDPIGGTNAAFTGLTGSFIPGGLTYNSHSLTFNFGQRPFAYPAPESFKALNTQNLPAPVIAKPATYMNPKLYTGDGSTRTISGVGFQPDLVWVKCRGATARDHKLTDANRGATKGLISNSTAAESTDTNGLTAFTNDGFSLGNDAVYNTSTDTYVAWNWKAGVTPGFYILSYTGDGNSGRTVSHGLGVAPKLMIFKRRDTADGWVTYHQNANANSQNGYMQLNSTQAWASDVAGFNNTAPSSTVVTLGNGTAVNLSGGTYVGYLWAEVPSFSRIAGYTGNGSTDGPFLWCGFRPRWLLVKRADAVDGWWIYDGLINSYNPLLAYFAANTSAAESTSGSQIAFDFVSNGVKVRNSGSSYNASGGAYVFAAFAEYPFKTARAR